jgi:hypothetical protein
MEKKNAEKFFCDEDETDIPHSNIDDLIHRQRNMPINQQTQMQQIISPASIHPVEPSLDLNPDTHQRTPQTQKLQKKNLSRKQEGSQKYEYSQGASSTQLNVDISPQALSKN